MTVRMGYDFAKTGAPKRRKTFWGEDEQRNERSFPACTETSDMKFATTRAKQRRGETPGQERHSGRTAKAFLTLSLLRAHFYTGVFHTSYWCAGNLRFPTRLTDNNSEVVSVLPSLRSEQGAGLACRLGQRFKMRCLLRSPPETRAPLRCYAAILQMLRICCAHCGYKTILQIIPYPQS